MINFSNKLNLQILLNLQPNLIHFVNFRKQFIIFYFKTALIQSLPPFFLIKLLAKKFFLQILFDHLFVISIPLNLNNFEVFDFYIFKFLI